MSIHWYIYEDAQEASAACSQKIITLLDQAVASRELATVAVSGGATPKLLFAELAKSNFDWSRVHLFWVDERGVPPTDSQSNYKLAKDYFIDAARFPEQNVHRIRAELGPQDAAGRYAEEIRSFFSLAPGEFPQFDVIHQGMGPDGHTASLFPGEKLIDDRASLVSVVHVEKFHQWRITMLPGILLAARHNVMLVAGEDKAEALRAVVHEPYDPKTYPVQIMTHQAADVMWFLDKAAARLVE